MHQLGNHLYNVLKTPSGIIDLTQPKIMGIINVTPDSFYDGGKFTQISEVLKQASKMIEEGADILDIGGYSSRPGAKDVTEEEEIARIQEPLKQIRSSFPNVQISIDTFRRRVAELALKNGADIVNDISAGEDSNEEIFEVVKHYQVPYILMHKKGKPMTMQKNPKYKHVVDEVFRYIAQKVAKLNAFGLNNLIVDPGFGFGKALEHNYQILNNLKTFQILGPVLVGVSRKSMINKVLNCTPSESLNGTSVLHAFSLLGGAKILRVHDVKPAFEAIQLFQQLKES